MPNKTKISNIDDEFINETNFNFTNLVAQDTISQSLTQTCCHFNKARISSLSVDSISDLPSGVLMFFLAPCLKVKIDQFD